MAPATLARQDVGHGHMLKNLHVVQLADGLEQLGRDLLARNVGMEGNARAAVRALAGKVEAAVGLALKIHAHRQQVVDEPSGLERIMMSTLSRRFS